MQVNGSLIKPSSLVKACTCSYNQAIASLLLPYMQHGIIR